MISLRVSIYDLIVAQEVAKSRSFLYQKKLQLINITMIDLTGRTDFNETWLMEMPAGLGSFETWDQLNYSITQRIKLGATVMPVTKNIFKIEGEQAIYYWYGTETTVILGTELYTKPQALVVSLTGKDPKFRGRSPYASDLYNAILKDKHRSIRFMSDVSLSDEGYGIWKRLVSQGHKVSLYDREQPGKTFKTFSEPSELDQYFADDDTDFKRYQFVLSENGEIFAETQSLFGTRRFRELIPGLL